MILPGSVPRGAEVAEVSRENGGLAPQRRGEEQDKLTFHGDCVELKE